MLPTGFKKPGGELERIRTRPGGGDEDEAPGQASVTLTCNVRVALLIGHANQRFKIFNDDSRSHGSSRGPKKKHLRACFSFFSLEISKIVFPGSSVTTYWHWGKSLSGRQSI